MEHYDIETRLLLAKTITSNGCWEGHWAKNNDYGHRAIKVKGKRLVLHREAYKAFIGEIPPDMCVLHKCDNPKCYNPDHLFLGTRADNVKDMYKKNRQYKPVGEKNNNSKLTIDDVVKIREMVLAGVSQKLVASLFNVKYKYIPFIIKRKRWAHI